MTTFWPTIICLFFRGRPSAISRFIIAVVVRPTVDALSGWPWSHITQKCREAVAPLITHSYSATTIVGIGSIVWIKATTLCGLPYPVCRSAAYSRSGSAGIAMSGATFSRGGEGIASTAFRIPAYQTTSKHIPFSSTVAAASPANVAAFAGGPQMQNRPIPELSSREVNKVAHIIFSFFVSSLAVCNIQSRRASWCRLFACRLCARSSQSIRSVLFSSSSPFTSVQCRPSTKLAQLPSEFIRMPLVRQYVRQFVQHQIRRRLPIWLEQSLGRPHAYPTDIPLFGMRDMSMGAGTKGAAATSINAAADKHWHGRKLFEQSDDSHWTPPFLNREYHKLLALSNRRYNGSGPGR